MKPETKTRNKNENALTVRLDAPELKAIPESRAKQIRKTFIPMADMLEAFESEYNGIIKALEKDGYTEEIIKRAKRARIDIGKIRIQTEHTRKEQKEEYLRAGKAIDGVSNLLKWAITEKENHLKEIEEHQEREAEKAREKLQEERVAQLEPYVTDAHERDLAGMDQEVWDIYLKSKKQAYQDQQEAEREAEERRRQEEINQKRIAKLHEQRQKETGPFYGHWPNYWDIAWGEMSDEEYGKELQAAKDAKKKAEEQEAERAAKAKTRETRLNEIRHLLEFFEVPAQQKIEELTPAEYQKCKKDAEQAKARREAEIKQQQQEQEQKRKEAEERALAEKKAREKAEADAEALRQEQERKEAEEQEKLAAGDQKKLEFLAVDLQEIMDKYKFKAKTNQAKWEKIKEHLERAQDLTGK